MKPTMDIFQLQRALQLHFKTEYCCKKYNFKVKQTGTIPDKLKLPIQKINKHKDPFGLMVCNLFKNPNMLLMDIAYSDEAQKEYQRWLKTKQSLEYQFKEDIKKLDGNVDRNFKVVGGSLPIVLDLYFQKEINLETVSIVIKLVNPMKYWRRELELNPLMEVVNRIEKYQRLFDYEMPKYKKIVVDLFGGK